MAVFFPALLILIASTTLHTSEVNVHETDVGAHQQLNCPEWNCNETLSECPTKWTYLWRRLQDCKDGIVPHSARFRQVNGSLTFRVTEHDFGIWACLTANFTNGVPTEPFTTVAVFTVQNTPKKLPRSLNCGGRQCLNPSQVCSKERVTSNGTLHTSEQCRVIYNLTDTALGRFNADPEDFCVTDNRLACGAKPLPSDTTPDGGTDVICCYCFRDNCNQREINVTKTGWAWVNTNSTEYNESAACVEIAKLRLKAEAKDESRRSQFWNILILVIFVIILSAGLVLLTKSAFTNRHHLKVAAAKVFKRSNCRFTENATQTELSDTAVNGPEAEDSD